MNTDLYNVICEVNNMGIRNTAKAIIIDNNRILVNKNQNSLGDICYGLSHGAIYYDLPGGGQNQYETLEEAVERECLEESGFTVTVDRLVAIYEEISINKEFRKQYEQYAHKVHFVFLCHLLDEPIKTVVEKDLDMLESEWVNIYNMKNIPLYPQIINSNLELLLKTQTPLFLGSQHVL